MKSCFSVCLFGLTDGTDCSLTFAAETLGKACVQGHSGEFTCLINNKCPFGFGSPLWGLMCFQVCSWQWRLLVCPPARARTWCGRGSVGGCWRTFRSDGWSLCSPGWFRLSVGTMWACPASSAGVFPPPLVNDTTRLLCFSRPDALGRIIGNLVLKNKKAQFVITHKLLLLQYKYEVRQLVRVNNECLRLNICCFPPDSGLENSSGLPCSRQRAKANAHTGECVPCSAAS